MSIAVIEPPNVPAQYRAAIIDIATTGSRPRVNGKSSATAMVELSPGSAPIMTPISTERKISTKLVGVKIRLTPVRIASRFKGLSSSKNMADDTRQKIHFKHDRKEPHHHGRENYDIRD
jgi:hypothetical protein